MTREEMEAEARRLLHEALRQGKLGGVILSRVDDGLSRRLLALRQALAVTDKQSGGTAVEA